MNSPDKLASEERKKLEERLIEYVHKNSHTKRSTQCATLGLAMGAGILHGYCDAKGVPLSAQTEFLLTCCPILIMGYTNAVGFWDLGYKAEENKLEILTTKNIANPLDKTLGSEGAKIVMPSLMAICGVTYGTIVGTLLTSIGYGLGYVSFMKV